MSDTNQQPFAGIAGSPSGIVLVKTANFMILTSGSPVGVIAGQSGNASTPPDMVWDYTNAVLWICTVSGSTPATTTWSQINIVGTGEFTNLVASGSLTVAGTTSLGSTLTVGGPATGVTPTVGDNSTKFATTAFVNTALAPAFDSIGRNYLHNARFTIQQRGGGPWTTVSYTADQWGLYFVSDSNSVTVATLTDTDRSQIGDEAATYALLDTFVGGGSSGDVSTLYQKIEGVRRLSNKTISVSFWARASSGTPKIGVAVQQNFGSGGSPSATTLLSLGATAALSSAWTYYTLSGLVPSASGKTFGTTPGTDYTTLNLVLSDYSNDYGTGVGQQSGTVAIWGVQLEIGAAASPLEKRDPQVELALCQRYYVVFIYLLVGGYNTSGGLVYSDLTFPVTMRATPSVTYSSTFYSNASGVTLNAVTPTDIRSNVTITSTGYGYSSGATVCSAEL